MAIRILYGAKNAMRAPIDIAMKSIAKVIDRPYVDECIELRPQSTIVLESGEEVAI